MSIQINILPEIELIEETPIVLDEKNVGWHVNIKSKYGYIGSGVGLELNVARRIAVAESVERITFLKLTEIQKKKILFDDYPTTCGFAAGFEADGAKFRSISEAIERWGWSKWIDDGFHIPELKVINLNILTPIAKFFLKQFDSYRLYEIHLNTKDLQFLNFPDKVKFCIFLGFKNDGVFPGSRVCSVHEDGWTHSVTEAWRHFVIFNSNIDCDAVFPIKRICYFGKNSEKAVNIIQNSNNTQWPEMKLLLHECIDSKIKNTYIFRTLLFDYIGWDKGDEKRFVY